MGMSCLLSTMVGTRLRSQDLLNGLLRCEVSVAPNILAHLLLVMPCAKRSSLSIKAHASLLAQDSLQRTCQRDLFLHLFTRQHPAFYLPAEDVCLAAHCCAC